MLKKLDLENKILKEDMEAMYASGADWSKLDGATCLVTGASGMLSSYLVLFLVYLNECRQIRCHIVAEVRSRQKLAERFGEYLEKEYFELFEGEISDLSCFQDRTFDYIIHAASMASPQYYGIRPVETMLPNILGTHFLLEHMKKKPGKGFLFFSSGSVYGSIENTECISEGMAGPLQFLAPGNVYGESKRCGEALALAYFREYQIPVKIARIHHTYGPTMDYQNDTRVFASFVKNIIQGDDIVMKSDGSAKRAFCYITDMLSGMLRILLDAPAGEAYNIANETEYISIKGLAERLAAMYPEKSLSVKTVAEEQDGRCPSQEKRIIPVSCEKLESLGWRPQVTVESGFKRTIEFLTEG